MHLIGRRRGLDGWLHRWLQDTAGRVGAADSSPHEEDLSDEQLSAGGCICEVGAPSPWRREWRSWGGPFSVQGRLTSGLRSRPNGL